MAQQIEWPRCTCGATAHDHNRDTGQAPFNYGADRNPECQGYTMPEGTPFAVRDLLYRRMISVEVSLLKLA